jgi:alkanesulfonate monooxygenase SsuD/methylene tetrahydromethanopterin reductase-like flavin-dependent oxidoreductase (luciferase family)
VIHQIARIAERSKFDLLFVSDGLDYEPGDLPSFMCRFEPTSLISVLSAHTTRPGLGATVSTSFAEPYNVARPFASIDHLTGRIGYDVSGYPLDGPVPPPPFEGGRTFHRVLYDMARRQNMTLRDLYNLTAAARGHWVICGTPAGIADTLEEWFVGGAADGYNILPAYFPGAFADFVDLVVPELQRRGLFRRDYEGTTLREHLGLPRVAAPARLRQAAGA